MKNEYRSAALIAGMVVLVLMCFSFIFVFAEPGDDETPGGDTPIVSTASPSETSAAKTTRPIKTIQVKTTQGKTTGVNKTTNPPLKTATQNKTSAAAKTSQPNTSAASTTAPQNTTKNPDAITMDPIKTGDILPVFNPEIKSKSEEYNSNPEKDLHGYNISIAASWDASGDININKEAVAAFEEKYNCKVTFLTLSRETIYNRLLRSCATGITYFDAILVDSSTVLVDLAPLGLLEEFSKYLTQDEINKIPDNYKRFLGKNDKLYAIPANAPDFSGIWVNNTLLNKYKIENPISSYEKNKWDWEVFNTTLHSSIGDKDEDGNYDLYGISTSSNIYLPILESSGGGLFRWTGDKFISGVTNTASIKGLSFVKNLYSNYYIANNYESNFYKETTAFLAGEASMYRDIKKYLPKSDISFLMYPSNTGGTKYTATASYTDCAAIVRTSKYPVHTAELLKIIYGGDNLNKRIEKYCADNNFTKQITGIYKKMLENFTIDFSKSFDKDLSTNKEIMSLLKNGTFNADAAGKTINPLIEKLIAQRAKPVNLKNVPVQISW